MRPHPLRAGRTLAAVFPLLLAVVGSSSLIARSGEPSEPPSRPPIEAIFDTEALPEPDPSHPEREFVRRLEVVEQQLVGHLTLHWAPDAAHAGLRIRGRPGVELSDLSIESGVAVAEAKATPDELDLVVGVRLGDRAELSAKQTRNLDVSDRRDRKSLATLWRWWLEALNVPVESIRRDLGRMRRANNEDWAELRRALLPLTRIASDDRAAIARLTEPELVRSARAVHLDVPRMGPEDGAAVDGAALARLLIRRVRGIRVTATELLPDRPAGTEDDSNASWKDPERAVVNVDAQAPASRVILSGEVGGDADRPDTEDWWWLPLVGADDLAPTPERPDGALRVVVRAGASGPPPLVEIATVRDAPRGLYIRVRPDPGHTEGDAGPVPYSVVIETSGPEGSVRFLERDRRGLPKWPY